jgi:hypothetical protein
MCRMSLHMMMMIMMMVMMVLLLLLLLMMIPLPAPLPLHHSSTLGAENQKRNQEAMNGSGFTHISMTKERRAELTEAKTAGDERS